MVSKDDMLEIDKLAMIKLNELITKVTEAYEKYQYNTVYHLIHSFCVVDMSSFYLDVTKDRLYVSSKESKERRSGQTAMYYIVNALVKILSPILTFTTEEAWGYMAHVENENVESVQLASWPKADDSCRDKAVEEKWDKIMTVRNDVLKALETARREKIIGQALAAKVTLYSKDYETFLNEVKEDLVTAFIVSQVEILKADFEDGTVGEETGIKVKVSPADGEKCERCWTYSHSVGEDKNHPTLCKRCSEFINK
jgi:isoleucyl-tRNA synthetase